MTSDNIRPKTIVCKQCGKEALNGKRGPDKLYCSAYCARHDRDGINQESCPVCGVAITGRKRKYCGATCRDVAMSNRPIVEKANTCQWCECWFLANAKRAYCSSACKSAHRAHKSTVAVSLCNHCGAAFKPVRNAVGAYCSVDCMNNDRAEQSSILSRAQWPDVPEHMFADCSRCGTFMGIFNANQTRSLCQPCTVGLNYIGMPCACGQCDGEYTIERSNQRSDLCDPCVRANKRKAKRASRSRRRAMMRDATCETFKPSDIFERDQYICQLCGVLTDESAHYNDPLYPTIDHIIPLSKGGQHSRSNTQCSCRKCNVDKSDEMPPDVLVLT